MSSGATAQRPPRPTPPGPTPPGPTPPGPTIQVMDGPDGRFTKVLIARYELCMREVMRAHGDIIDNAMRMLTSQLENTVMAEIEKGIGDIVKREVQLQIKTAVKDALADKIDDIIESAMENL